MKATWMFRVAAGLIALFAAGHTFGFRQVDPAWGITPLLDQLRAARFQAQGMTRSYYDFYLGLGFTASVLMVLAAVVAWQLGSAGSSTRVVGWAMTLAFALLTGLCWRYFFPVQAGFAAAITACLAAGVWLARA